MPRPTFEQACAQYVHRFTMEHVPSWAAKEAPCGGYYAPHYATDREWYDNSIFPGEARARAFFVGRKHCYSRNQSWPLGQWLENPYKKPIRKN